MAYDNGALIRRFFDEVWSNGQLGTADELVAAGCVEHNVASISGDIKGVEALKAQVREYRGAFPDLRFILQDVIVSGDTVVTRWTATGTHRAPLMGIAPTGKTTSVDGISITRILNGKLIETWVQWDTLKFMQNLGVAQPLGKSTTLRSDVRDVRPGN
jgi:steroid delta-isomerase-like uncharacterized protein